jgi:hypothetical protein
MNARCLPVSSTEVLEANVAAIRESLNEFKLEVRAAFSNINGEMRSLRERNDKNFERLSTRLDADVKDTRKELGELKETVLKIDSRQSAILWIGGGLAVLITLVVTIGKTFKWF